MGSEVVESVWFGSGESALHTAKVGVKAAGAAPSAWLGLVLVLLGEAVLGSSVRGLGMGTG